MKIKCIDKGGNRYITVGKIYDVMEIIGKYGWTYYSIINDINEKHDYAELYFEIMGEKKMYNVGDRVVITKSPAEKLKIKENSLGTIIKLGTRKDDPWHCIEFDNNIEGHDNDGNGKDEHCWWVSVDNFKKVGDRGMKVKDRVQIISLEDISNTNIKIGLKATIVKVEDENCDVGIGVKFDDDIDGHTCNGETAYGYGYWLGANNIEVINEEESVVLKDRNGLELKLDSKVRIGTLEGSVVGFKDETVLVSTEHFKAHVNASDVEIYDPKEKMFKDLEKEIEELGLELDTCIYRQFIDKALDEDSNLVFINSKIDDNLWDYETVMNVRNYLTDVLSLVDDIRRDRQA